MKEIREFYVIQFGGRKMKYLGGNYHRYLKVDSLHSAEKFDSENSAQ